jgi:predicted metal-dependent HD superfamily phosphohydrolase
VISPERSAALQASLVQTLSKYAVQPADAYHIFDRLEAMYGEAHRSYHTFEHLAEMFKVASKLADSATDMGAVQLAIWFHDAVYDPRARDNEERSAQLAFEWLRSLGVRDEALAQVAAMIRMTAHSNFSDVDANTAVLLDADLAILSAEERRYQRYAADIRREYAWVEDSAYRVGRIKVLESFLHRPRIYRTTRMYEVAEQLARRNLAAEIEQLGSVSVCGPVTPSLCSNCTLGL